MKKIAYIELDTHAEIARNFMELMQDSTQFQIDFYLSKKILKLMGNPENNSVFISDFSHILQQILSKKYDLVMIGTVHRHFNVFQKLVEKYRTAIIVHNINFTNSTAIQLIKNVWESDFLYRLKLLVKESLLSAPQVFKKANYLLVLDEDLKGDGFFHFPVVFNRFSGSPNADRLAVVIPGAVSQKRRDYQHIFDNIKILKPEKKIQFIFLGKAEGKEFQELKNLQNNIRQNVEIHFFSEKVPQNLFDDWMKKADVLWCPIQQKTDFLGIEEIYGTTKMTGNVIDAIKFGKPAIFPKQFSSNYRFIFQEENDFLNQIEKIQNQYFDFQKDFNQAKTLEKLEDTLTRLIKI